MCSKKILFKEPNSKRAKKFKATDADNPQPASVDNISSSVGVSPQDLFSEIKVQEKLPSSSSGGTFNSFPPLLEQRTALRI